jgi:hypothetical protein
MKVEWTERKSFWKKLKHFIIQPIKQKVSNTLSQPYLLGDINFQSLDHSDLLEKLKMFKTQTKSEKKKAPVVDEGLHKRKQSTSPGSPKPERTMEVEYTVEQLEVVKQVKK